MGDLSDPMVIAELKRLEVEGLSGLPPEAELQDAASGADTSSGSFDGLPLPEVDTSVKVPWTRYFVLFFVILVAFRLLDSSLVRSAVVWLWRRVISRIIYAVLPSGSASP